MNKKIFPITNCRMCGRQYDIYAIGTNNIYLCSECQKTVKYMLEEGKIRK